MSGMKFFKIILMLGGWVGLFPTAAALAFSCQVSAGSLNFPAYNIFSSYPADSTATLRVYCNIPDNNPHSPLSVTMSLSTGSSGNFSQRQMLSLSGADRLNYNLFTDSTYSSVWGDNAAIPNTQTKSVSKNSPWDALVYGRIPPRQNVSPGQYSDTIIVTIEW